jgi:proteasome lid subunit RPN8/RPN11
MRLRLDAGLLDEMVRHFRECLPEEGCGFLIGRADTASRFVPAPNSLRSKSAFEVDPRFLFDLFRSLRAEGESVVGICHSHPRGPAVPSPHDIASAYYPDSFQVIVSMASAEPDVRAWRIVGGEVLEAEVHANI